MSTCMSCQRTKVTDWRARCPLCAAENDAMHKPASRTTLFRDPKRRDILLYNAVDHIGAALSAHGIICNHDGSGCGYDYFGHYLEPGTADWDRAIEWLPFDVAALLQAHAAAYPAYYHTNAIAR